MKSARRAFYERVFKLFVRWQVLHRHYKLLTILFKAARSRYFNKHRLHSSSDALKSTAGARRFSAQQVRNNYLQMACLASARVIKKEFSLRIGKVRTARMRTTCRAWLGNSARVWKSCCVRNCAGNDFEMTLNWFMTMGCRQKASVFHISTTFSLWRGRKLFRSC